MKNLSRRAPTAILSVSISALLLAGTALAAPPGAKARGVMKDSVSSAGVELPSHAKANSGRTGRLNADVLSANSLTLTLADGQTIKARLQRVAKNENKGQQSWVGTFDDAPGSILVLTRHKGVVTGFANYLERVFELQPGAAEGEYLLFEVDNSKLPEGEVVRTSDTQANDEPSAIDDYGLGASTQGAADAVVQDVLVLYTARTASRYGPVAIEGRIQSAVEAAIQAYQNSQINITMNPVGIQQTTVVEQGSMGATLNALETDSSVARLRDELAADVVILVSEDGTYCGMANLMTTNSTSFASRAFGVVFSSCLSNQSLAHETGHIQGVMHDRASSSGWSGVYPYSYGYRRCVGDGNGFRDVMSYSCSGAPRVLVFSNPNVTWNGYAAGISYESDPSNSAENARSINNTAGTVAAFRNASNVSTPPTPPSGLSINSAEYDRVTIGWNDNASNETGYDVERSSDGVAYSRIASLGADSRSFADSNVSPGATYYYRARAFNSAGPSAYSNDDSVTVPDAPPPPPPPPPTPQAPTSVTATDNANGSATVSWAVGSSNTATSFEVRRETYNNRQRRWRSATTVATVSANVSSIADVSGNGTFRYSVRGRNDSGSSAYAGPRQVTVTGASGSPGGKGKGKGKK